MTGGEVQEAWGDWIAGAWRWDWFFTGTFSDPKDQGTRTTVGWSASDRYFREWVSDVEQTYHLDPSGVDVRDTSTGLWWVRAREPHQVRDSTHFHALIGGVGNLRRDQAWRLWFERHGQCRIEPVRPGAGAALYVAKYINKAGGELVFSEDAGMWRLK